MSMIGDINSGMDPFIAAAKNEITIPEMLQALAKFASEKWEEAKCKRKQIVLVTNDHGTWEVVQDGIAVEDAEEILRGAGFVRAPS